jgi:hypothetical protein
VEENTNTQQTPEQNQAPQQPEPEQKKVLMPGQEHEDELDFMGALLFGLVGKGFGWVKKRFSPRKVQ